MSDPATEYQHRHQVALRQQQQLEQRSRLLGNVRLALAIAAILLLWLALGQHIVSPWLAAVPAALFVVCVVVHQTVLKHRLRVSRRVAFYSEGLDRLHDKWMGTGSTGEAFRQKDHIFADDLDLFGTGSLFQLISRARTATGEKTLAQWLLEPADPHTVTSRHEAVRELSALLDLREDIALLGETVGNTIHPSTLTEWAQTPAATRFIRFRLISPLLALLNIVTLLAFFRAGWPIFPFLLAFLCNVAVLFFTRYTRARVLSSLETPAHDLNILSALIARLEQQTFVSSSLRQFAAAFTTDGTPASKRIARLRRLVELADSADHVLLRLLDPLILFRQQIAAALENWKRENGSYVGRWLSATGEFEALSSIACLAYERPAWCFPTLLESGLWCEGSAIGHPLIPQARSVPNDVSLNEQTALLIISGSNMSGKSTLLRAVGLNVILAWAGAPVCAQALTLAPVQLGASIRVTDSLQDNRSRFLAEITRLRAIVERAQQRLPLLFLLDELLSGTNSHDRRIGAAAVVRGLLQQGAFGFITTHDLALADIAKDLDGRARNLHFEDQVVDGEMHFDYHLREGVVTRSNALALMRAVGLNIAPEL